MDDSFVDDIALSVLGNVSEPEEKKEELKEEG